MSQNQNYDCGCKENTTSIPIRGINISIDNDLLKQCECTGSNGGRIRVTEDLHVYVDGNRTESGNGLTPETAVKSYEDAVDVLSRYDGCNRFDAVMHFASLENAGKYPLITLRNNHGALFMSLILEGESHEQTSFVAIQATVGSITRVRNLQFGYLYSSGHITLEGKISTHGPSLPQSGIISANRGGSIEIASTAQLFIYGSGLSHFACLTAANGGGVSIGAIPFTIMDSLTVTTGFAFSYGAGSMFIGSCTFSGKVTGTKYHVSTCGVIYTGGKGVNFLPGTTAGSAVAGGVYA